MAYSNKALPPGTVLREWRLEEVLGVGGFGIVYKGRGIYFDELVAIKEYFPSSISERDAEDTVVPIDSAAEEVHALGLKKFVEEAKLLWNLSTPSRHPNIVSVRSLFEIHGTAYMVMDFEDGVSLSKVLRSGRRWNEASLRAMLQPIAEGLERAHRVGVLHRDIKPPNILINEDGRPVLIDFGSARFESAEATSTKVTFHTPPYAAIEQYVKTYAQGPWTDIYALGVVLHECVTGEKPPEVLERLHGGLGSPLAGQEWPGYSRAFLKAVDAAMTIRPGDRPQSIPEWLALFDAPDTLGDEPEPALPEPGDEATRFVSYQELPPEITPVVPPPPGFAGVERIEVPVPDDVSEVRFRRAGEDTSAGRKVAAPESPAPDVAHVPVDPGPAMSPAAATPPASTPPAAPAARQGAKPGTSKGLLVGGAALVVAALGAGYVATRPANDKGIVRELGRQALSTAASSDAAAAGAPSEAASEAPAATADGRALAVQALAADARKAGAPSAAIAALASATTPAADPASAVRSGVVAFARALGADADRRGTKIAVAAANPAAARPATTMRGARSAIDAAVGAAGAAADPAAAVGAGRKALAGWRAFGTAQAKVAAAVKAASASARPTPAADSAAAGDRGAATATARAIAGSTGARTGQLAAVVASGSELADRVIALGRARPRAGADEKANGKALQDNAKAAQGYLRYFDTLTSSMRGVKSEAEAQRLIAQGEQTKRYLTVMLSRSSAAAR